MKVFISWSGARSRNVAEILRGWIPKVLQAVRPWMSDEDIATGTRWSSEIASELESSKAGIVCITPENQHNPWLMFEAGALSKTLSETYVCPYLFDLSPSQLSGPIAQFQATLATKEGTLKIIQTLNKTLGSTQIANAELDEIFEVWWPKLDEKLSQIDNSSPVDVKKRPAEDILDEILKNSREQLRREEIRLSSYQEMEKKNSELIPMFENMIKNINIPLSFIENFQEKMSNFAQNILKSQENTDEQHVNDLINENGMDVEKLKQMKISSIDMQTMMKKIKEIDSNKKKETDLLLKPCGIDTDRQS